MTSDQMPASRLADVPFRLRAGRAARLDAIVAPDPRPGRVREADAPAAGDAREARAAPVRRAAGRRGAGRRARRPRSSRFALFFTNFSTFLAQPGLYLEDLFVEPSTRPRHRRGAADAPRPARRRARLRPLRMERARLERERDPLLRADGRDGACPTGASAASPGRRSRPSALDDDRRAPRRSRPLRRAARRLSLARAGALQHRRGLLRALGARARPTRSRSAASTRTARAPTTPTPSCTAPPTGSPMRCAGSASSRGDRVAIVMPQRFETAVAHIALYRLGAVAMPLSMLFGPDALEYRINDSEATRRDRRREPHRQRARGAAGLSGAARP